jgi:hypothetical protein
MKKIVAVNSRSKKASWLERGWSALRENLEAAMIYRGDSTRLPDMTADDGDTDRTQL